MTDVQETLWKLQCNNKKCGKFFDYFGRLRPHTGIACTHCGKSSQHRLADFMRHNPGKHRV